MNILHISTEETDSNDANDEFEESRYVGALKVLASRRISPGNGLDDAGTTITWMVARRRISSAKERRRYSRAIVETIGGSNCTHDHDCCGCVSRHVDVAAAKGRAFAVRVRALRNY